MKTTTRKPLLLRNLRLPPFQQGQAAHARGVQHMFNPFRENMSEHAEWRQGWQTEQAQLELQQAATQQRQRFWTQWVLAFGAAFLISKNWR